MGANAVTSTTDDTTPETTTTTKKPKVHPPGLVVGDSGPKVQSLQQQLAALKYDVGTDGRYGDATYQAVMAFQKVTGMKRTGAATDDVVAALATAGPPKALVPGGGSMRVEVDIARQVLFLYQGNQLAKILAVSTGTGRHYCENGDCGVAVTPGGSFRISRRITGWHTSPLGKLYNPMFFNGGIAIHGAPSVPGYPASHGCVRIPMSAADWFYAAVPNGTPVYVLGGPNAPAPPIIVDKPTTTSSTPGSTTSTTHPKSTTTTAPSTTTTSTPAPTPTTP
jgi:lipoprotein-anchoring transpeptidase ErfK/SrfK